MWDSCGKGLRMASCKLKSKPEIKEEKIKQTNKQTNMPQTQNVNFCLDSVLNLFGYTEVKAIHVTLGEIAMSHINGINLEPA